MENPCTYGQLTNDHGGKDYTMFERRSLKLIVLGKLDRHI